MSATRKNMNKSLLLFQPAAGLRLGGTAEMPLEAALRLE
jgi:hypothetical protein